MNHTPAASQPGPYGARERAGLATLDAHLRAADPTARTETAPGVADLLRQQLPDLDDTTIGRVLIALTTGPGFLAAVARQPQHPQAQHIAGRIWAALASTGLDLTAPTWQPDQHPEPEPEPGI